MSNVRTGIGFDAHRFQSGRVLFLAGVEVESTRGLAGHSDADVLIHALMDALLGAAGEGDIGTHFPPGAPEYKDVSSVNLLGWTVDILRRKDYRVVNVDLVLIGEEPRIGRYVPEMRSRLGEMLGIESRNVSIKATTTEGMGFTGRGEGLAGMAVATIEKG
ncbi:MAG: 2-C-methyl-D-erythritol 2,4-cyclodiphosphate synthase [Verrucomicrobiota bacterium]